MNDILKRVRKKVQYCIRFVADFKLTPVIMCKTILLLLFVMSVYVSFSNCKDWRELEAGENECVDKRYGMDGYITSPLFPFKNYPPNSFCKHEIDVPEEMVIKFTFDVLDMEGEPIQKRSNCGSDSLTIEEIINGTISLVGGQRFCGSDIVFNSLFTKTNYATVIFSSDGDFQRRGFLLAWKAVPTPAPSFNCTFEDSEGLCAGWEQLGNDQSDWVVQHGTTWSSRYNHVTGPTIDHTLSTPRGTYAYLEATGLREDDKTWLLSPEVSSNPDEEQCVVFWYHMFGSNMGKLFVREAVAENSSFKPARIVFGMAGDSGNEWKMGQFIVLPSEESKRFIFEAIRGMDYRSDIAIDDISIINGPCPL